MDLPHKQTRRKKMEVLVSMQELKLNCATKVTEKVLEKEQNVSHKVLTHLINSNVEEKLKQKKKKIKK